MAAFVLAACAGDESPDSAATGPPGPLIVPSEPGLVCEWAAVLEVIDGDTIRVSYRGNRESVRLIGVDTPEVNHPDRGEEPFGREAAEFVEDTLDSWICLESDITNRDSFGRLLRYGWLADTRLLNELLVTSCSLPGAWPRSAPSRRTFAISTTATYRHRTPLVRQASGSGLLTPPASAMRPIRTCASRRARPISTAPISTSAGSP
ncbi:MAG: thermonuclease family protein [Dehalococcoidia bacterium]